MRKKTKKIKYCHKHPDIPLTDKGTCSLCQIDDGFRVASKLMKALEGNFVGKEK